MSNFKQKILFFIYSLKDFNFSWIRHPFQFDCFHSCSSWDHHYRHHHHCRLSHHCRHLHHHDYQKHQKWTIITIPPQLITLATEGSSPMLPPHNPGEGQNFNVRCASWGFTGTDCIPAGNPCSYSQTAKAHAHCSPIPKKHSRNLFSF